LKRYLDAAVRIGVVLGLAAVLIGTAACSSDGDEGGGNGSASAAAVAVDPSGTITVVAKDNFFEPKQFTGPANQAITVKLDNQGAAIHNFAVKGQKGPDGNEIGALKLVPGKQSDTIQFTLPAGTYDYYCTVHPVEMTGKMTLR
jgi:plastocyanin